MTVPQDVNAVVQQCLAQDIDAWTRRILRRHFDPDTGSPYWLRKAAELPFNPLDITRYEELLAFEPFPIDELRSIDPAELVPMAVPRPLTGKVFESGGTTGNPCRVYYTDTMLKVRGAWRLWAICQGGFQPDRNWLQAMPSGPHLIGHNGWDYLMRRYGARVYGIDFDPRWVKRQLRAGRLREAQEYTDHVVDQAIDVLTTQPVSYLGTTPALMKVLVRRAPDLLAKVDGVVMSGTHTTPAMWRSFKESVDGGLVTIMYGNTFGPTTVPVVRDDGELMAHLPNYPQITMAVVDRQDWRRTVEVGESGQVRLTVLQEDLLLPNVLERDQAVRYRPDVEWPCDGVANVRPLLDARAAPEGIY
ncbi:arylcarboxylate reductase [Micromonospora eburnea]|uniref:AMP-binding enzyme n=1 Tax=Micromonospora eburnea TaxID=227316 RepID=A0A1C6UIN7_9ACTN|nr:arylcarboxylate reductase [Micromonospora eburnea]SCL53955.1 hypothetical protein GA0070604_2890 [Micromonospora eburnea]